MLILNIIWDAIKSGAASFTPIHVPGSRTSLGQTPEHGQEPGLEVELIQTQAPSNFFGPDGVGKVEMQNFRV